MYRIVYLFTGYKKKKITKVKASILTSILGLVFCLAVLADIGLYYWIKTGSSNEILPLVTLVVCAIPVLLPIFFVGSYIQLSYQDKIQQTVISIARKEQKRNNNQT
jgi:O-antigen/teichoic acid export membrane protein